MERWLRREVGPEIALRIEHYGSTAVPGMPAKPVVDILVEVPSFRKVKERALRCTNDETWEYWWYSDHMVFFKRKKLMGERLYHIHIAPAGHVVWNAIAFRDYLKAHSEEAERYVALKRKLAVSYAQDREGYTEAKTEYVKEITAKALTEGGYDQRGI